MDRIALVVSDVDGTLVTTQKRVTERTRQAVAALHKCGIGFTVVSSRPAFGLRMLIDALAIKVPVAAFNGGVIASPQLDIIEQRGLDGGVASEVLDFLEARQLGAWVFTTEDWFTRDLAGAHVSHETITVQRRPTLVASFAPVVDRAIKIVGVSDDYARLAASEEQARATFAARVTAARSQNYYLDFVAPGVNKGSAVEALSKATGVPPAQIATLGDMENDVPMFRHSGFSIAMGNASDAVKHEARASTSTNDEDGFAGAIEHFILPSAA